MELKSHGGDVPRRPGYGREGADALTVEVQLIQVHISMSHRENNTVWIFFWSIDSVQRALLATTLPYTGSEFRTSMDGAGIVVLTKRRLKLTAVVIAADL